MKKATLLTAVLLGSALFANTALAAPANQFKDVPGNHWSYAAIERLAKAGIVTGYEDGSFKGDRTMTRYEMAQIVDKAYVNIDKATKPQKDLLEKLAREYDERLAKVEAKQGNVKIGGQARFTYTYRNDNTISSPLGENQNRNSYFTYRLRIDATAKFDNVLVYARLRAQDNDLTSGDYQSSTTAGTFNAVRVEQFMLKWMQAFNVDGLSITAGRTNFTLGNWGLVYTAGDSDQIFAEYNKSKFYAKLGVLSTPKGLANANKDGGDRILFSQLSYKLGDKGQKGNINLFNERSLTNGIAPASGAMYQWSNHKDINLVGIGFDYKFTPKFAIMGEFGKNTGYSEANKAYWFGITTGNSKIHPGFGAVANPANKGEFAWALLYRHTERNINYAVDNQLQSNLGGGNVGGGLVLADTRGVELYTSYIFAKNAAIANQLGYAKGLYNSARKSTYFTTQIVLNF